MFDLDVDAQESVLSMKQKIVQQRGYHAEQMKLMFGGKVLKDEETTNQLAVKNCSYIMLLMQV